MNNFDIARNAVETSATSEGSAMKEHEKWMESAEAKINQLKATWESFSLSFLNSDFLKGTISGLTEILNILDKLISNVGTLPTLIGAITASMSLKNVGRDKMFSLLYYYL